MACSRAHDWVVRIAVALVALLAFIPSAARAQSVNTYTQSTTGTINASTTCAAPLVRNFTVGTSYTVGNVDLALLVTHTYRGDVRVTLQAPDGTRVQLVDGDSNTISGDNLNVRLDDSAAQVVNTDSATGAHSTTAPPFQNTFAPNGALSAFAGKNSAGTWRLEVCDIYPTADNGSFRYAELYLTSAPATFADLSLTKTVVGAAPASGGSVTYRLTVANAAYSTAAASGVTVRDYLPPGFTFTAASGTGTFNAVTETWSVGSIPVGQTRSIDITGTVTATAGATITNVAEITASSVADVDSTVGNGVASEDDQSSAAFTVAGTRTAGTPPALSCPLGTSVFDWDPLAWTAGSTANTYSFSTYGNVGFTLANPGTWLNDAALGGQSPNLQTALNGGLTGQKALIELVNLPSVSSRVTTTITLPTVFQGAQFRVFDIDFAAGQFADTVTVEGRYLGATVVPTLTNGTTNYVVGNSAYGDSAAATGSGDGNVVATFSSPIDTIIIYYGNHSASPSDPGQQAIALGDITLCNPTTVLAVSKTSALVSDPSNGTTNPKLVPGAVVEYCLLVSNPGVVSATTVIATDPLPATTTYLAGSLVSGSSCAAASTAEDDDNAGADESDPLGASFAAGTVTARAATLAAGQSMALKFRATVR